MAINPLNPMQQILQKVAYQTQEEVLEKKQKNNSLFIGIPKEITMQENRVPLSPSSVEYLVNNGHQIIIEANAGKNANFADREYSEAGAQIVRSHEAVFNADIILKIDPPTLAEADLMRQNQLLISALQLNNLDELLIRKLLANKVNAIAFEFLEDESGSYPVIRAMSEIAGHASILIASEYLTNTHVGKGELLGGFPGIPPTQVVIIGAGAVGEYAAKAALGLGASVKVFDNSIYRLRRLQDSLGHRIFTSTIHPKALLTALQTADVAIGALRAENDRSPCIVTEQMVMQMKAKSVIIDVSADHGGVFETTNATNHKNPINKVHEVIHFAVPNIASRFSRTASYALSNIFTPLLMNIAEHNDYKNFIKTNKGAKMGTYVYNGSLTNIVLRDKFSLLFKNIDILLY